MTDAPPPIDAPIRRKRTAFAIWLLGLGLAIAAVAGGVGPMLGR
ncbi:MAG: hypothetical protein ACOYJ6_10540 [Caulobacterales bacterium]|jgi:hypothetical protein